MRWKPQRWKQLFSGLVKAWQEGRIVFHALVSLCKSEATSAQTFCGCHVSIATTPMKLLAANDVAAPLRQAISDELAIPNKTCMAT